MNDDGTGEENFSSIPASSWCIALYPPYRILFKVTGPINSLHHVSVAGDTAGMRVNGEDHI